LEDAGIARLQDGGMRVTVLEATEACFRVRVRILVLTNRPVGFIFGACRPAALPGSLRGRSEPGSNCEAMEVPAELASRFKSARQKPKLAGTIRGSYCDFENDY
jgi:hypothetical protein